MTQEMRDIRNRIEALVDRWLSTPPADRAKLLLEKMRLEEAFEQAKTRTHVS